MSMFNSVKNERRLKSFLFWKHMVNGWSIVTFVVYFLHFFWRAQFESADSLIAIIYPAVLTIYVGQKEFLRWKDKKFTSHFAGEYFVHIWTAVFVFFVLTSVLSGGRYQVTFEMVTTYVAVLSVYAVTQQSKRLRT